jgi:hypothetical protein
VRCNCIGDLSAIDFDLPFPLLDGMNRKRRYIVRLDEVNITRQGDSAAIEYKEPGIPTTYLPIGPEVAEMSDVSILRILPLAC